MNIKLIVLFFIIHISTQLSYAVEIENSCWDNNGSNNFTVLLSGGTFSGNKENSTAIFKYKLAEYNVLCSIKAIAIESGGISLVLPKALGYQTATVLPVSDYGNGFLKLNEDLDVKIDIAGPYGHTVPLVAPMSVNILNVQIDTVLPRKESFGTEATVTFRLRRTQLSGVVRIPPGIELFKAHGSLNSSVIRNNTPMAKFNTSEIIAPVPVICTINNGEIINVNFGDIDNTRIANSPSDTSYTKNIPIRMACSAPMTQDVYVQVIATASPLSPLLITTSLANDIGISIKHNGNIVKPNGVIRTSLINGVGQDELQAIPVNPEPLKAITGEFTASAVLVMTLI